MNTNKKKENEYKIEVSKLDDEDNGNSKPAVQTQK